MSKLTLTLALALVCTLTACNGSSNPQYITLPASGNGSSSISASPNQLSFTTTGSQQSFTVTDPGNNGTLTASSSTCSGIATFSPTTATGTTLTVNVTSVAAGSCAISVADGGSHQVSVAVGVTTTGGHIQSHSR